MVAVGKGAEIYMVIFAYMLVTDDEMGKRSCMSNEQQDMVRMNYNYVK